MVNVYCDMSLPGGGWTVILKRKTLDGPQENFTRKWNDYVKGFGKFNEEFILGLELIHHMTENNNMELFIGLQSHDTVWRDKTNCDVYKFAKYSSFSIATASANYKLSIGGYDKSSTAGDSLAEHHNDIEFSTYDRDNDGHGDENCAHRYRGGWWYHDCHVSQLTGVYRKKGSKSDDGIVWDSWLGKNYSLKSAIMAIRPKDRV